MRSWPLLFLLLLITTAVSFAHNPEPQPLFLPLVIAGGASSEQPPPTDPLLSVAQATEDDWVTCRNIPPAGVNGLAGNLFNVATDAKSHPRLLCAIYSPRGGTDGTGTLIHGIARYHTAAIWFTMPETTSSAYSGWRGGYSAMRLLPSEPLSMTVTLRVGAGGLVTGRLSFPIAHAECDPAYPDVCIPPPPPDLHCDAVSYHYIRLADPAVDPHGLDADGDGMGCE